MTVTGSLEGLREVRYSLDGCGLDRRLPFRPWTYLGEDQGDVNDGLIKIAASVESVCVQLVFRDGEVTEQRQYHRRPNG